MFGYTSVDKIGISASKLNQISCFFAPLVFNVSRTFFPLLDQLFLNSQGHTVHSQLILKITHPDSYDKS